MVGLIEQNLSLSTVKRIFSSVKAFINLTIQECVLDINNPFSKTYIPKIEDKQHRKSIPTKTIIHVQSICRKCDNELRWLVTLINKCLMKSSF